MTETLRPLIELSILAAALMVTGLIALLQRRPELIPEWPPSPPRPPRLRQRVATIGGGMFLTSALLVMAFVIAGAASALTPGRSVAAEGAAPQPVDEASTDLDALTRRPDDVLLIPVSVPPSEADRSGDGVHGWRPARSGQNRPR